MKGTSLWGFNQLIFENSILSIWSYLEFSWIFVSVIGLDFLLITLFRYSGVCPDHCGGDEDELTGIDILPFIGYSKQYDSVS